MSIFKPGGIAIAIAAVLLATSAEAASLRISQVADKAPDLMVFLSSSVAPAAQDAAASAASTPSSTSAAASSASAPRTGVNAGASVALGNASLSVKSLAPWDRNDGLALVLAVDVSASLGDAGFRAVKQQVRALLDKLPARSQVAVIAIGSEVRTVQGFGPVASAAKSLDTLVANAPETALYEALLTAQELAAQPRPELPLRRAVLVLTDGLDDSRRGVGRDEALQKITRGEAPVYAVALAPSRVPAAQLDAIKVLAQIARASGGGFVQTAPSDLANGLGTLMAQVQQVQVLTADCSGCPRDGAARTLQVSLWQRNEPSSDAREIRLFVARAPAASAPVSVTPPAPSAPIASGPRGGPASVALWMWAVAAAILLVAILLVLWWRRRRTSVNDIPVTRIVRPTEDLTIPPETTRRRVDIPMSFLGPEPLVSGQELTLHVSGKQNWQHLLTGQIVFGRAQRPPGTMGDFYYSLEHDAKASSRHAALVFEDPHVILHDLGSSNGTFLNGTRITRPEPVHDRDVILIGHTEIRVYFGYL